VGGDSSNGPERRSLKRREIDPDREFVHPDGLLRLLDDPVTALAPWLAFAFLLDSIGFLPAALLAFGLSLGLVFVSWLRGEQPKAFEVSDAVLFGIVCCFGLVNNPASDSWIADHADAVSNISLTAIGFGSFLIGRPFTAPYTAARFSGSDPALLARLDRWSTLIWSFGLLVASVFTWYGEWVLKQPDNIWTAWILQTMPLVVALDLTLWIDRRAVAWEKGMLWMRPPPVRLARDLVAWLIPIGILSLVFDGAEPWFGALLVTAGSLALVATWFRLHRTRIRAAERMATSLTT
jgi:hypothetical protein